MTQVQTEDARIHYRLSGVEDGPALVLLNSIGTDMSLWDACLAPLEKDWRVLRIDTRGHGQSDASEGDYTLALLARDILAVMDDAGIVSAHVAGVSLGGMIAMQMALDHGDRVDGLSLICTSATMDASAWQQRMETVREGGLAAIADMAIARFLSPGFIDANPAKADAMKQALLASSATGYVGACAAIRDMNLAERLSRIAVPTDVITGVLDVSTPYEPHGRFLVEHIPAARHHALESAHLPPVEAPEALLALLKPAV